MQREYPVLYEFQALKQSRSHKHDGPRTLCITKHLLIESFVNDIINVHRLLITLCTFFSNLHFLIQEYMRFARLAIIRVSTCCCLGLY